MKSLRPKTAKVQSLVLAFVTAVILWIFIAFSANPEVSITTKVPVVFTGIDELRVRDLAVVNKESMNYLPIEVTGTRGALAENIGNIYIEASLDDVNSEGTAVVPTKVVIPSSSLSLVRLKYDSFSVNVEEIEEKEIPITIKHMGNNERYMVESVPEYDTLTITGARSEIENIESAVLNVDISGLEQDMTEIYTPLLLNDDEVPITKPISVYMDKTTISVQNNLYVEKTIPLTVKVSDSVSSKYSVNIKDISPDEITVGVKESYLAAVSALELVFDDEEYQDGEAEYTISPNEAEGVFIPDASTEITVSAEIYKKISDTLVLPVEVRNMSEGGSAEQATVIVSVYGPNNILNGNNITAYVDASGLTPGLYTLPVYFDKDDNIIVSSDYTCKIEIK